MVLLQGAGTSLTAWIETPEPLRQPEIIDGSVPLPARWDGSLLANKRFALQAIAGPAWECRELVLGYIPNQAGKIPGHRDCRFVRGHLASHQLLVLVAQAFLGFPGARLGEIRSLACLVLQAVAFPGPNRYV